MIQKPSTRLWSNAKKNKKDYTEIINRLAEQGFWGDWANKYTQGHDNEDDDGKAE